MTAEFSPTPLAEILAKLAPLARIRTPHTHGSTVAIDRDGGAFVARAGSTRTANAVAARGATEAEAATKLLGKLEDEARRAAASDMACDRVYRGYPRDVEGARYFLEGGEETALSDFIALNADALSDEEIGALVALAVGESFEGGGGASGTWTLARIA